MASTLRTVFFALGFTTLGATAGITAGAIAGPHGGKSGKGAMKFAMAMAGLDLSAEQQQMLTDLRDEVRTDMKASRGMGDESKAFAEAIAAGGEVDRAALHTRIDEAAAAKTAIAHKTIDGLIDVYESLDTEQKAELSEMIEARMEQHDRRKEQFGGERGPRGND